MLSICSKSSDSLPIWHHIEEGSMAVYIEDDETCRLISQYAELKHTSKTGALRDLLRRELKAVERKASAEERYKKVMSWLGSAPEISPEPVPSMGPADAGPYGRGTGLNLAATF
jgi:hypothetical protein